MQVVEKKSTREDSILFLIFEPEDECLVRINVGVKEYPAIEYSEEDGDN